MCKLSINNMLWLALMSVVQNKHLLMLESWRYAVRHSQRFCSLCQELYHSAFFSFLTLPVLKTTQFSGNFKANNRYSLLDLDENWLDDTYGGLLYRYSQKCIMIPYLFRVYRCTPSDSTLAT